jgi:hypothetical protein
MMGPLDVDTHPCGPHRLREVFGPPNDPDVDSFFFPQSCDVLWVVLSARTRSHLPPLWTRDVIVAARRHPRPNELFVNATATQHKTHWPH